MMHRFRVEIKRLLYVVICVMSMYLYATAVHAAPAALRDRDAVNSVAEPAGQAAEFFARAENSEALKALELASAKALALSPGQARAIAGYEIKDAVFAALTENRLNDKKAQHKAIRLALQSLTPENRIAQESSSTERINDASFLYRISQWYMKEGNAGEAAEMLLLVLSFNSAMNASRITEWLLKKRDYTDVRRLLEAVCDNNEKASIVSGATQYLPYGLSFPFRLKKAGLSHGPQPAQDASFDETKTLFYADELEKLMQTISTELKRLGRAPAFTVWHIKVHRYIWESYYVAGTPHDSRMKLQEWLSEIRSLEDRTIRVRETIDTAQTISLISRDNKKALSLLHEAEKETELIDKPVFRKEFQEGISRLKSNWSK